MISELSILMPCYNNECYELVAGLHAQAESIISSGRALRYEIVVADDGSTDAAIVARNRRIDTLPGCRYVLRSRNTGRAAIRNFLARMAGYGWLLFIDSDMSLRNASFISNYISLDGVDVVYGGYTVDNLTAVSLNEEVQSDGDCFAGAQKGVNLYEEENSLAVTLRRPVACIRYVDKNGGTLPEGNVSVVYSPLHTVYNVITGETTGEPVPVTRTLNLVTGEDYFAADYVFVPGGEEALDITLTVGEHVQDMRGITVKTNMVTRIQGDFIK